MPDQFHMDISRLVEYSEALVARRGLARARRIVECELAHHDGVACICGWDDDGTMPDPDVAPGPAA